MFPIILEYYHYHQAIGCVKFVVIFVMQVLKLVRNAIFGFVMQVLTVCYAKRPWIKKVCYQGPECIY